MTKVLPCLLIALMFTINSDATEITNTVLQGVVDTFHSSISGEKPVDVQMGFLIMLTADQCQGSTAVEYKWNNQDGAQILSLTDLQTADLNSIVNYIAVYSSSSGKCIDNEILFCENNGHDSWAEKLGKVMRPSLTHGGCLVLYTTNTPCLDKCFSGGGQDTVSKLHKNPFGDLPELDKYFVYSRLYCPQDQFYKTKQNFEQYHIASYLIYRCMIEENNRNRLGPCEPCIEPEFCLVGSDSEVPAGVRRRKVLRRSQDSWKQWGAMSKLRSHSRRRPSRG